MRKTLREQLIKQSLNGYMWSRYLVASVSQECPLIIGHHNGLDMDDLTTDCFDLNLSLLVELRDALKGKGASPLYKTGEQKAPSSRVSRRRQSGLRRP